MIRPGSIATGKRDEACVVFSCEGGSLAVRFFTDTIIQVAFFAGDVAFDGPGFGVVADAPIEGDLRLSRTKTARRVAGTVLSADVDCEDSGTAFVLRSDDRVLARCTGFGLEAADDGLFRAQLRFEAPEDEAFLGLGSADGEYVNRCGSEVLLSPGRGVPLLISGAGYGILADAPGCATVAVGINGANTWDIEAVPAASFFFIHGESPAEVLEGYCRLTGASPLLPAATLDLVHGNDSYTDEQAVSEVLQGYCDRHYNCGTITLARGHLAAPGAFGLDGAHWSEPEELAKRLGEAHCRLAVSIAPRFAVDGPRHAQLQERGLLVTAADGSACVADSAGFLDPTTPEARAWLWQELAESYRPLGPVDWALEGAAPGDALADATLSAGPVRAIGGLYPLHLAEAIYEGNRNSHGVRTALFTDGVAPGIQRYGAIVRRAASEATWEGLRRQIATGLSLAASGMPYWATDVGGQRLTDGDCTDAEEPELQDLELYVRWFQYGAFSPIFRLAGRRANSELWALGKDPERILSTYTRLRARLLPYLYSSAYQCHRTGMPLGRPLVFDFPGDSLVAHVSDQYMLGPSIMVAPVTTPGQSVREVYLPEGCAWYDYWTDARHNGGRTIEVMTPLEMLPVFVRAGAIIPHTDGAYGTDRFKKVELRVYQGGDGDFELFYDDYTSFDYEQGAGHVVRLHWDDVGKAMNVEHDDDGLFARAETEWLKRIGRAQPQLF